MKSTHLTVFLMFSLRLFAMQTDERDFSELSMLTSRQLIHLLGMAANNDDIELLNDLKRLNVDLNTIIDETGTALHHAAKAGKKKAVRWLLTHSTAINTQNAVGETPLLIAAAKPKILMMLLNNGADPNARDQTGCSRIHQEAMVGNWNLTKLLLDHNATAIAQNNEIITPIHLAAQRGHANYIMCLLYHGADAEARDEDDITPLIYAALESNRNCLPYLIGAGAQINDISKHGSALDLAIEWNKLETVQWLIEHGADYDPQKHISTIQNCYQHPLLRAIATATHSTPACIIPVDTMDMILKTALLMACARGLDTQVTALINYLGKNITRNELYRAILRATDAGRVSTLKLLIETYLKQSYHDGLFKNMISHALMRAAVQRKRSCIAYLLSFAPPTQRAINQLYGLTTYQTLNPDAQREYFTIIEILMNHDTIHETLHDAPENSWFQLLPPELRQQVLRQMMPGFIS